MGFRAWNMFEFDTDLVDIIHTSRYLWRIFNNITFLEIQQFCNIG